MAYQYKIRAVDTTNGTFLIQFEGLEPLNMWIPHDDTGYLTGEALDAAIQTMYPWDAQQRQMFSSFTNGSIIEGLVEPFPIQAPTAEDIRNQRDLFLIRSDWTQLTDVTLTEQQKSAWAVYRQELRDITAQPGFPENVTWPNQPV